VTTAILLSRENIGGTLRKKVVRGKEKSPVMVPGLELSVPFLSQTI